MIRGTRLQRRITAWLSLAAMVLITVAPGVPTVFDVPHCPPGIAQLAMASEEARHDHAEHAVSSSESEHCAMCLLFGAPFGLIRPDVPVIPAASDERTPYAGPEPRAPAARVAYHPAQPRAPPGVA